MPPSRLSPVIKFLVHAIKLLRKTRLIFRRENILLTNALFCFCYAISFIFLVAVTITDAELRGRSFSFSVTPLKIIFFLIMVLNVNTISVLYRAIQKPRKIHIAVVFYIMIITWIAYVFVSGYLALFMPGFITHFHYPVQANFFSGGWYMVVVNSVFAMGMSLLFIEYYRQIRLSYLLYFIVPAIIHFAFRNMFPFLFFIVGWLVYCGCQLLLYFSLLDAPAPTVQKTCPQNTQQGVLSATNQVG